MWHTFAIICPKFGETVRKNIQNYPSGNRNSTAAWEVEMLAVRDNFREMILKFQL